jgi:uncharacterized membrane protein
MTSNDSAIFTILGMAVVTYLTRIGGLWVMNRVRITPRIGSWLKALPGTILISIVAPSLTTTGIAEPLSGLITGLVAWKSRNLVLSMVVGIASVWSLRHLF